MLTEIEILSILIWGMAGLYILGALAWSVADADWFREVLVDMGITPSVSCLPTTITGF